LAEAGGCRPYARLNVHIGEEDELGTFIFRTTGFNSIRTLGARLHYLHAVSGGLLATLPLELRLRGKSTSQSMGTPIFYVDLTIRSGVTLTEALAQARELDAARRAGGFCQEDLDWAARDGFALGAFEESTDEGPSIVEEFFPEKSAGPCESSSTAAPVSLGQKLSKRAAVLKQA
jgi:hypothetical protein